MKAAEKLFDLLQDSGATMLTVLPRDAENQPMGVIVIAHESIAQQFLEFMEQWTPPNASYPIWSDEDE